MTKALARKGSIYLVKYESGLYGVEKITKSCSGGLKYSENKEEVVKFFAEYIKLKYSENKEEVVKFFAEYIKSVRRSKNDFNLEVYGN